MNNMYENELPPYTMEDLQKDKPEYYDLVVQFYACGDEVKLLSDEMMAKYESLDENELNITDRIDCNGKSVYESFIEDIHQKTTERKELVQEVKEKIDAIGMLNLEIYCQKMYQDLDYDESSSEKSLCTSDRVREIHWYEEKTTDLESLLGEVATIDQKEIEVFKEVLENERAKCDHESKKLERKKMVDNLCQVLWITTELSKRMGLQIVTNNNSVSNLPFDHLEKISEKLKEYNTLTEAYGGDDTHNTIEDIKEIMDELFA